jgi:hypothetical protein
MRLKLGKIRIKKKFQKKNLQNARFSGLK